MADNTCPDCGDDHSKRLYEVEHSEDGEDVILVMFDRGEDDADSDPDEPIVHVMNPEAAIALATDLLIEAQEALNRRKRTLVDPSAEKEPGSDIKATTSDLGIA